MIQKQRSAILLTSLVRKNLTSDQTNIETEFAPAKNI